MLELDINFQRNEFELDIATVIGAGVTAIYGPSGSGKTSLLKAIAGLVPAQGQITFMGTTWLDTAQQIRAYQRPTYQRPIGLLFQDDRLFAPPRCARQPELRREARTTQKARRGAPSDKANFTRRGRGDV